MDIKKITVLFVMTMIVLIGGYDIYAVFSGGTEASISHLLISWSYDYPAFTFLIGFTCGHLFWRLKTDKKG